MLETGAHAGGHQYVEGQKSARYQDHHPTPERRGRQVGDLDVVGFPLQQGQGSRQLVAQGGPAPAWSQSGASGHLGSAQNLVAVHQTTWAVHRIWLRCIRSPEQCKVGK